MSNTREYVERALEAAGITATPADIEALVAAYPGLLETAARLRAVPEAKEESMELSRHLVP